MPIVMVQKQKTDPTYLSDDMVVLVDTSDKEIGVMEKLEAHRKGRLHRAFSAFIFNSKGELLLQKRANSKYHSGGLWTNTCCSHPRPGEDLVAAVIRRLEEEMGIGCEVGFRFKFQYKSQLSNGLIEHEIDHVFFGVYEGIPALNPGEVSDWRFLALDQVKSDVSRNPHLYTAWFSIALPKIEEHLGE